MKTRTDLLNHLAEKYKLQKYLEIGVQDRAQNFNKINCALKVCVDPDPNAKADCQCTSDQFFDMNEPFTNIDITSITDTYRKEITRDNRFDLVFIDGLHTAKQVKKDFENALKILSPNGFIVLHDCNPEKEEHTIVPRPSARGHWNGDVYKFACELITKVTVDIDNGCAVIQGGLSDYYYRDAPLSWQHFTDGRKEYLNLITWDEFISINPHV
jgi:hypothetical protein